MSKASVIALWVSLFSALANDVVLDASFRPPVFESYAPVDRVATAWDGKIYVAGGFSSVGSFSRPRLARVLSNGRPDLSFDARQVQDVTGMLPLADGRLLIGGSVVLTNGETRTGVFRLLKNGALDRSYLGEYLGIAGNPLAIDSKGKVYVQLDAAPHLVRLGKEGALDSIFNTGAGFDGPVTSVLIQPDGGVIVGGYFEWYGAVLSPRLIRFRRDDSVDLNFQLNIQLGLSDFVCALLPGPNRRLYVAGSLGEVPALHPYWPGETAARVVALLEADGRLVESFNVQSFFPGVMDLLQIPAGDLFLGGMIDGVNDRMTGGAVVISPTGTFRRQGIPGTNYWTRFFRYDLNRVLALDQTPGVAGPSQLRRFYYSGLQDGFRVVAATNAIPNFVVPTSSGKLLAAGTFDLINGVQSFGAAVLKTNGLRDASFSFNKGPDGPINCMLALTNGQILIGGKFSKFDGRTAVGFCRVDSKGGFKGAMKTPFVIPAPKPEGVPGESPPFPEITQFIRCGDGQIIALGSFNGSTVTNRGIMRFRGDGAEDITFSFQNEIPWPILPYDFWNRLSLEAFLPLHDGGLLVSGMIGGCDIEDCIYGGRAIARISPSGAWDTNFDLTKTLIHTNNNSWTPIAEQSGNRFLVTSNGWPDATLIRLFGDGSVDESFRAVVLDSLTVFKSITLGDGSIYVLGEFQNVDGKPRKWIARVFKDGGLDESFDAGEAFDGPIGDLIPQSDGSWIVHGRFEHVNGIPTAGLARVRWN